MSNPLRLSATESIRGPNVHEIGYRGLIVIFHPGLAPWAIPSIFHALILEYDVIPFPPACRSAS